MTRSGAGWCAHAPFRTNAEGRRDQRRGRSSSLSEPRPASSFRANSRNRAAMLGLTRPAPATPEQSCRQCGAARPGPSVTFCRRCGIPYGSAPSAQAQLPSCPICYVTVDDAGLLASLAGSGRRVAIAEHVTEHERYPVGDDDWLESLRVGDRIKVGDGWAPFDLVRRYLV